MSRPKAVVTLDRYVVDVLLPDLVGHDKRPAAYVLYVWLWANTRGAGRKSAFFSYQSIVDRTGLSKTTVQRAAAWLARRHLVRIRRASATAVPEYAVLTPWVRDA
jgi:Helix-turn-helix domain